jgi:hypothetical protein
MKKIKQFSFIIFIFYFNSCSGDRKENTLMYVRGFADENLIDCTKIYKLCGTEQKKYKLEDIVPNWKVINSSPKTIKKKITNTILEQSWEKDKSHYYAYSEKSKILLIVHFKNVDLTELFLAEDNKLKKSICKVFEQKKFILNLLHEPTPLMYQ